MNNGELRPLQELEPTIKLTDAREALDTLLRTELERAGNDTVRFNLETNFRNVKDGINEGVGFTDGQVLLVGLRMSRMGKRDSQTEQAIIDAMEIAAFINTCTREVK